MKSDISRRTLDRYGFIETRLFWEGGITANMLGEAFDISRQAAQKVIDDYRNTFPGQMEYDGNLKRHIPAETFEPVFIRSDPMLFLDYLRGQQLTAHYRDEADWSDLSVADADRHLRPKLSLDPVRTVLEALRRRRVVTIDYRKKDLESDSLTIRAISPNHLVFADNRYHIRAYCHHRNYFLDFVLSRIVCAELADEKISDEDWVGTGAIAQGDKSSSAGKRGVAASGDVDKSNIITGDHNRFVQIQTFIQNFAVKDDGVSEETLRRHYLYRVLNTTKPLPLEGIDPTASDKCESGMNLSAVYTALRTIETEKSLEPERMAGGEQKFSSALEQMDIHRHLVLLGDPGTGKTTFLNFAAMCMAGELLKDESINLELLTRPLPSKDDRDDKEAKNQNWKHGSLLPVPVVLREFAASGLPDKGTVASSFHLFRFIADDLAKSNLLQYLPYLFKELAENGGLILLDGLDEVSEAENRRVQMRQVIEDLRNTFQNCRILVTSRTYAYQNQNWRIPGMTETVLAPFDDAQIESFVKRWYAHVCALKGRHDAEGRAASLIHAISNSERLREIVEKPLLLTLTASLHAWRGGSLPEKRAELYADAVDLLLDWWEKHKKAYVNRPF